MVSRFRQAWRTHVCLQRSRRGVGYRRRHPRSDRSPSMEPPLAGVRVLDFGMAAVGPVSAEYMAMLGADVIKIESPSGDIVRNAKGGALGWAGHTFLGNNIGKRGVVLDLKNDDDRGTALMLVRTADIL